jgi:hypothetical protein
LVKELKVGDWVEVIGQPCGLEKKPIGAKLRISEITLDGNYGTSAWIYPASSLRNLAPSEIPGQSIPESAAKARLAANALRDFYSRGMDSRLEEIGSALAQLLKSIEKVKSEKNKLEEALQDHARVNCERFHEIGKRLSFLESLSKENAELTDIGAIAAIGMFGPIPAGIASAIHHESEEAEKRKRKGGKEELEARRLYLLRNIAADMKTICTERLTPRRLHAMYDHEITRRAELEKVEKQLAEGQ